MGKQEQHASPAVTVGPQDARIAALEARVAELTRQLAEVPELARRVELATAASAILAGAGVRPPPQHAKRKHRDRPEWLEGVIPGGLAAAAPVAFAAHGGMAPVGALAARWVLRSPRATLAVATLVLALGVAWSGDTAVSPAPREPGPAVCAHWCVSAAAEPDADDDAVPPLGWHRVPRDR